MQSEEAPHETPNIHFIDGQVFLVTAHQRDLRSNNMQRRIYNTVQPIRGPRPGRTAAHPRQAAPISRSLRTVRRPPIRPTSTLLSDRSTASTRRSALPERNPALEQIGGTEPPPQLTTERIHEALASGRSAGEEGEEQEDRRKKR